MTMKESKSVTKDPICGMSVEEATALQAERDGKKHYFAVISVGKSFCLRPPVPRRRASLDAAVDKNAANAGLISAADIRVAVRVIRTDEEWMIAKTFCRVFGLSEIN
jgi:YHS domain-containing protein